MATKKKVKAVEPEVFSSVEPEVAAGVGADSRHYLVLDGWTGISGNNLASVLLYFDEDTQQMVPADLKFLSF